MTTRRKALFALSGLATTGGTANAPGLLTSLKAVSTPADSAVFQARYDDLANTGGGTLTFPPGIHRVSLNLHSRRVHLQGAGRDATILKPSRAGGTVLRATANDGVWDAVTISDLTVSAEREPNSIGLSYGQSDIDRFAGRTILRNVKFVDIETCIERPTGNIGLVLEDCQFEDAAFHIRGKSVRTSDGQIMHNGVLLARRCHFQRAAKAVLYVDSDVIGSGQIVFDACIFEGNPGFVLAIARFEAREAVPGISLRSCWSEANATGGADSRLSLGGRLRDPAFLFADRVASIELDDMPPGRTVLLGDTTVITRNCALDHFELEADDAARVVHYDAKALGNKIIPGITYSVASGNLLNAATTGPIFHLPHRAAIIKPVINDARIVESFRSPVTVNGSRRTSTNNVYDSILPGENRSQSLTLVSRDHFTLGTLEIPASGGFVAWTLAYRLASGCPPEFQMTGSQAISTTMRLAAVEWQTIGGLAYVDDKLDQLGPFINAIDGPAVLHIGGFQLICFRNRESATEMLNDRLFRDIPAKL